MLKRIYSYITITAGCALFLVACSDDDDNKITHFSTVVNVDKASIKSAKYDVVTLFSTDDGATFVEYPIIAVGQQYKVKVVNGDSDVTEENCFNTDWSASQPAPSSVEGGVATFVMGSVTDLAATVTNIPLVASTLAGTYTVETDSWEDYFPGDELTVEVIDATHIRIVEYPGTSVEHNPLAITITNLEFGTVSVPAQYSGSYGGSNPAANKITTSGTGSICNGTISLTLTFVYPSGATYAGNHLVISKN